MCDNLFSELINSIYWEMQHSDNHNNDMNVFHFCLASRATCVLSVKLRRMKKQNVAVEMHTNDALNSFINMLNVNHVGDR